MNLQELLVEKGAQGINNLTIKQFVQSRGLELQESFIENQTILSIPIDVCWKASDLLSITVLKELVTKNPISEDDMLAILLMYYLHYNPLSTQRDKIWQKHLELVPKTFSSAIYFTENELYYSRGSNFNTMIGNLQTQIANDFTTLQDKIFQSNEKLFPNDTFNLELYKWALCTIWSRGMDFQVPRNNSVQNIRLLAPFVDLINGSQDVKQCHRYNIQNQTIEILAGKNYEKFDQLYINYGPLGNSTLLLIYGFVYENNANDSYDLYLSTEPSCSDFDLKNQLWTLMGMYSTCSISLTSCNPLPIQVLQYLVIQRATRAELLEMLHKQQISKDLKSMAAHALLDAVGGIVSAYHSISYLEANLDRSTVNARNCIIVALGELKILTACLKACEAII